MPAVGNQYELRFFCRGHQFIDTEAYKLNLQSQKNQENCRQKATGANKQYRTHMLGQNTHKTLKQSIFQKDAKQMSEKW